MKVLMQGKVDLFRSFGGDYIQIKKTSEELKKLGVEVDVIAKADIDYSKYDLVHLFQLDWTPETYLNAINAHNAKKPIVLSPIHHSVKEVEMFDTHYVFGLRRLSKYLFKDQFKRDTLKNVYKSFTDKEKIYPTLVSIIKGFKKIQQKTLSLADMVLVQTKLEAHDLHTTYGVENVWKKVPNGVGEPFINYVFNKHSKDVPIEILRLKRDYILCVGRIEARKNQLSIIEAVKRLRKDKNYDYKLVFVGSKSKLRHFEYVRKFEKEVSENNWITHINKIDYDDMPYLYSNASVCVSASWFETTGLTSLEALFCGTNAVAAGRRAYEYLEDNAFYCKPNDIESISSAIYEAFTSKRPVISDRIKNEYTWKNAAQKTLDAYNECLNTKNL